LSADLSKAYELLGVKPGVSNRDLKAAHRDLAKVWHPDRFLHDARLQAKAQEKLKEINAAYELLSSGKTPRVARTDYTPPVKTRRRRGNSMLLPVATFVFIGVFAITITVLLRHRAPAVAEPKIQTDMQTDSNADQQRSSTAGIARKPAREDQKPPENSTTEVVTTQPTPALATVTVAIDPESGLLARPDCPVRSRMTYPRGNEPSSYCNIVHTPPRKDSKIKSIAKGVTRIG
jgi:DnaJ-like protein